MFTFSNVSWQAAHRRGFHMAEDQLVLSLLASERVGRLVVCNHARSFALKLARGITGSDRVPFPTDERTSLVEPLRVRRSDPSSLAAVKRGFAAYDRALARAVRRHQLDDPVIITAHPLVAGFSELAWARAVTWYAVDDWAEHPAYRRWWQAYRESYRRVRASGRRVAGVSSVLLDRLAPSGPRAIVPNGIEPAEWIGQAQVPDWVAGISRPLLLYVGGLDSRIDVSWVRALARAQPSATVVLAGPLLAPDHLAPLRSEPNVEIRSPLGRRELTGLVRASDVGLLPHVRSRLTEAMSPLKLLEYLAAGLPVAATDLIPVRDLGHPRVLRVAAGGDYVDAVRGALAVGRASEPERLAFLEANSWRSRHERVLDLALA